MGKTYRHYGKDGTFYDTLDEMRKADARWEQQEKQNKLLEEQNNLLKQQNNSNNYSSSYNAPLTESTENSFSAKDELKYSLSSTNPIVCKYDDIKFALFFHTVGIIIIFLIANAGIIDSFLYYCLRIGTGNTDNKIGLGIFTVYLMYYILLYIKKLKYKKLSIKEIEKEREKFEKLIQDSEELGKEIEKEYEPENKITNTEMKKEYEPENKITNMIDIDKFCTLYNENLQKYYKFFGKDIENEQLKSTDIDSYCIASNDFSYEESDDFNKLHLKLYTITKNDIKISLACNENGIIVTATIYDIEQNDNASNELIKRIYLPFLSAITSKNIEDAIIVWKELIDTDDWKFKENEYNYTLKDDTYMLMITNLIFLNFIPRKEE
ncbi:MAG: hypothetical protein IKF97_06670 [Clostridia bacterium]|nr:hypothetical protein [Clostridia bacterium]